LYTFNEGKKIERDVKKSKLKEIGIAEIKKKTEYVFAKMLVKLGRIAFCPYY